MKSRRSKLADGKDHEGVIRSPEKDARWQKLRERSLDKNLRTTLLTL